MEQERVNHRLQEGDRWVEARMQRISEIEDLAEEMKQLKAHERLQRMHRQWGRLEAEQQSRVNANRQAQLERLRPLTAMGVDLEKLVMSERISPMLARNEALAARRQTVAQRDRHRAHTELKLAKEQARFADLSITRKTAEDRAERLWHLEMAGTTSAAAMAATHPGVNDSFGQPGPLEYAKYESGEGMHLPEPGDLEGSMTMES